MTISKYDKFAIYPKRCNKCNRLFVFESYNIYYKEIGGGFDIKQIKCKKCCDKKESDKMCSSYRKSI